MRSGPRKRNFNDLQANKQLNGVICGQFILEIPTLVANIFKILSSLLFRHRRTAPFATETSLVLQQNEVLQNLVFIKLSRQGCDRQ